MARSGLKHDPGPGSRHPVGQALAGALAGIAVSLLGQLSLAWTDVPVQSWSSLGVEVAAHAAGGALLAFGLTASGLAGSGVTAGLALLLLAWCVAGRVALGAHGSPMVAAGAPIVGLVLGLVAGQLAGRIPPVGGARQGIAVALIIWLGLAAPLQRVLLPPLGDAVSVAGLVVAGLIAVVLGGIVGALSDDREVAVPQLAVVVLVALASLGLLGDVSARTAAPSAPTATASSVVLVLLDGLRADHAHPWAVADMRRVTPELATLASRSTRYTDAIAPAPWALPSVTSVLTGRMPDQHGAGVNDGSSGDHGALRVSTPTLGERLASVGVVSHGVTADLGLRRRGVARGFTTFWDRARPPYPLMVAPVLAGGRREAPTLAELESAALATIAAMPATGAFVLVHVPYARAPYWPDAADVAAVGRSGEPWPYDQYDATLLAIDRVVGRLAAATPASQVLIVAGTHGLTLVEKREVRPPEGHLAGANVHVENVAVPLLVRGPGWPSVVVSAPVSLVDIASTVLRHFGAPADDDDAGRPLPQRDDAAANARQVFSHGVRFGREWQSVRERAYGLVRTARGDLTVYDRQADPREARAMLGEANRETVLQRLAGTLPAVGAGATLLRAEPVRAQLSGWLGSAARPAATVAPATVAAREHASLRDDMPRE